MELRNELKQESGHQWVGISSQKYSIALGQSPVAELGKPVSSLTASILICNACYVHIFKWIKDNTYLVS